MNSLGINERQRLIEKIRAYSKQKEESLEKDNEKESLEEKSLFQDGKIESHKEDYQYDINKRQGLENQRYEENTRLRTQYARKVVCFMYAYFTLVMAIIFLQGFSYRDFHIAEVALTTLIGGAFVSAIGLVGFVVKGLFPKRVDD